MARTDSPKGDNSSDSSKKVARAARAGQTAGTPGKEQRELGFPLALAAVIVVGIALVAFARANRDTTSLTPTFGDHWHIAYGIYDCTTDSFLPNLADPQTPNSGIHTHGDGVVHLHPRGSDATGNNAQLKQFLDATRTEINDDSELTFPDRDSLAEGVTCDGESAVLQVARFAPFTQELVSVTTEDVEDYRFLEDQEAITIALAPLGAEIPPPPQENIDQASAASPFVLATDGLGDINNLDGTTDDTSTVGFDDDGNLVDADGNILIPAEELNASTEGDEDSDN